MNTAIDMSNIEVPELPIEVKLGDWIISHPDCDSVMEDIEGSSHVLIHAYATSKAGNRPLHAFRDANMPGKEITKGVSANGIRKII